MLSKIQSRSWKEWKVFFHERPVFVQTFFSVYCQAKSDFLSWVNSPEFMEEINLSFLIVKPAYYVWKAGEN